MVKIALLYILPAAFLIYALVDCVQDDEVERTGVPKPLWILLIILIFPYLGPLAWLVVSKIAKPKSGGQGRRGAGGGPFGNRGQARPMAPDDDPEFLRKLAEDQWLRERRKQREAEQKDDGGDGAS
ncbi:MAG: PLDc N-terminal domain-containing protein [Bifidobacteriaceae bacterium]|nr:PLDc N-terminal domain-containing protein [Bifidobacteriaceae bacterium]